MKQYLNNLIDELYSSFTRMKSRVITANLVTLVGVYPPAGKIVNMDYQRWSNDLANVLLS